MSARYVRWWIPTLAGAVIAVTVLWWFQSSKSRSNPTKVAAAEDEVYEAVVRNMIAPAHRQPEVRQLVFTTELITGPEPENTNSCKQTTSASLQNEAQGNKPMFNSFADKAYRLVTRGWYDESLPQSAVVNFAERACTEGRLSERFHTDLPKAFISQGSVHFADVQPLKGNGTKSFGEMFPGAGGIISFSHVGFDPTLHEAIVTTSFVCGMLCGAGTRYVLRKEWGRWRVANEWTLWVS